MSKIWVLAIILGACTGKAHVQPPAPPSGVQIADEVMQNMFEIQREYSVETVRCLTGFVVGDTVYVAGMTPTWIDYQDNKEVRFQPCTTPNTVGWFHNHPPLPGPNGTLHFCVPSDGDINTTRGLANFWVAVLTCGDWTVVWRFKESDALHIHTFPEYIYATSTRTR